MTKVFSKLGLMVVLLAIMAAMHPQPLESNFMIIIAMGSFAFLFFGNE